MITSISKLYRAAQPLCKEGLVDNIAAKVKAAGINPDRLNCLDILHLAGLKPTLWALAHGNDDARRVHVLACLAYAQGLEQYTASCPDTYQDLRECNKITHLFLHGEASTGELEDASSRAERLVLAWWRKNDLPHAITSRIAAVALATFSAACFAEGNTGRPATYCVHQWEYVTGRDIEDKPADILKSILLQYEEK